MNIISWNVRGLRRPAKRFLVKDFLNLHFVDVCCLQESKLEEVPPSVWREIGGSRLDQFFFVPALGTAGGIILGWNSVLMSGNLLRMGTFNIKVEFCSKHENLTWRCTSVYGPNARSLKCAFWEELRENVGAPGVLLIICGDFNAIFDVGNKNWGLPNLEDIRMANAFLHELKLLEPSSMGRRFTWTNGQAEPTWMKLDRFIVSEDCMSRFPKMVQNCLP